MTYETCHAEDSCLKNHPHRPGQAENPVQQCAGAGAGAGTADRDRDRDGAPSRPSTQSSRWRGSRDDDGHSNSPGLSPSPSAGHGPDHEHRLGAGGHRDPEKTPALQYGDLPARSGSAEPGLTRDDENLDFPEGGLQAWLVVFGSFCAMLSVFGIINTAAVFESYFSTNQLSEYSASQIGWIFGLYLFIVFFVGIQVGPIFDKHGPRIVVALGGVLIAASLLILSVCEGERPIFLGP